MSIYSQPATARRAPAFQPTYAARPSSDFEHALSQAPLRRVEAREFLFAEGDAHSHFYRIETGAIALYKILPDGRRQVLGFAYPGEIIGLGVSEEHAMHAQAVKPTRVRCLPVATLQLCAAKDPSLGLKLYEALARELAAMRDLLFTTGQRSALERLAGFLVAMSRRNERIGKERNAFELPMTRSDIGDFLGLTIETVSRTFTKLKQMQLLELPHNNEVRLLDIDRLENLADGELA